MLTLAGWVETDWDAAESICLELDEKALQRLVGDRVHRPAVTAEPRSEGDCWPLEMPESWLE
jgi:hypothetical protein